MQIVSKSSGTMSSFALRELINAERLNNQEASVRNDQFIARIEDELGDELKGVQKYYTPHFGNEVVTIDLTFDQCILVGMRESKAVRRAILAKLKELEEGQAPKPPSTFAEALRLAADQAEQIEQQQKALAIAAPKVEFVDQYVEATGSMTFRQVCKLLGANEREFREFLREKGIMYKLGGEWTAYAPHIDAGRFEVKTGTATHNDHAYTSARFTPKGVEWVSALWRKEAA